jgi:hypothetical protein
MLVGTRAWRLKLELLRIVVKTSTGRRFRARLGPELKKGLAEKVRELRSTASPKAASPKLR